MKNIERLVDQLLELILSNQSYLKCLLNDKIIQLATVEAMFDLANENLNNVE